MRRQIQLLALVAAAGPLWAACEQRPRSTSDKTPRGETSILCTFLPVYIFTLNIARDVPGVTVQMLLPANAGCPHDYVASTRDAKLFARADLLVAFGGIDTGVARTAHETNSNLRLIIASDHVETPEPHSHHDHSGDSPDNPHVWVSPRRASELVRIIAARLAEADPDRAEAYRRNAEAYAARLDRLAGEFASMADKLRGARIVTVHNVFDVLAEDLGLDIVATIRRSGGSDPSPRDMHDIVRIIQAEKALAVFSEPQYPADLPQQIAREAGVPCRVLDPVAGGPRHPGLTYYEDTMRANLETLIETLKP